MKYLIKNCTLIHPGHRSHGKKVDIAIKKGEIVDIKSRIKAGNEKVIEGQDLYVSAGWVDVGTHLGEPGYEHRETTTSLARAAFAGGYTDLITMPGTEPVVESSSQVEAMINLGARHGINIHPLAALSQGMQGGNLAELTDMHFAGAVGFTDGLGRQTSAGLLMRALQYCRRFDGLVMITPNHVQLGHGDLIHEGEVSITLGMKGSPDMAETLPMYEALQLVRYTEGRLCMHAVSSRSGVELLDQFDGHVLSGVSYLNLVATDEVVEGFDTNVKVLPVLRSSKDQASLLSAVKKGKISYICSNHVPLEIEQKKLEYAYAGHGAIGLETVFAALCTYTNLPMETIIAALTSGPRQVFGLPEVDLSKGAKAQLTVVDADRQWVYTSADIKSKSRNTPFVDRAFTGRVVATFNGAHSYTL